MSKKQVVVIDDNNLWLEFLSRQLQKSGYVVLAHTNSTEAIDDITPSVDLIIVDLLLGYNTVFPLLHELQSDLEVADIPVIACSSLASSIPEESLTGYGVKAILDKTTMTPEDVSVAVKKFLA